MLGRRNKKRVLRRKRKLFARFVVDRELEVELLFRDRLARVYVAPGRPRDDLFFYALDEPVVLGLTTQAMFDGWSWIEDA